MKRWPYFVKSVLLCFLAAPFAISSADAQDERLFSMHGSNTVGAKLAPALVEAYFRQRGAQQVTSRAGGANEMLIEADLPEGKRQIAIASHGSNTGFQDFFAGKCDIVMSSRRVNEQETATAQAQGFGNLQGRASEHVIGIDGIAVIVNKANPVERLTLTQLTKIFSGEIADWKEVGGTSAPIHVFCRDKESGTRATFEEKTLGKQLTMTPTAKEFESNEELSRQVLLDPSAIGFVGLPYVGGNRALALSEGDSIPLRPSVFTVRSEDYVLSRRLYLYHAESLSNSAAQTFIQFALSDEGQKLVKLAGFVDLSLAAETLAAANAEPPTPQTQAEPSQPQDAAVQTPEEQGTFFPQDYHAQLLEQADIPDAYKQLIAKAERLKINFRFNTNSDALDNLAHVDIERLMNFLALPELQERKVILAGFADNKGSWEHNEQLSLRRAESVSQALSVAGIPVERVHGFSEAVPVGSNETEEGRALNRRVEIWLTR